MSVDENSAKERIFNRTGNQPGRTLKPIVLKLKKGKSKKAEGPVDESEEKYSKGLADIQRLEGNVRRIAQKTTKAISKSIDVYERERQQSARAKTDGAIEDFIHNSAKAGSAYLKEAADLPIELADAVNPSHYRKRLRRNLRRVSKLISLFRI
jgi:hypothetical protein